MMMEPEAPKNTHTLEQHLQTYGIRRFDDDDYWSWGGGVLGERRGKRLEALRRPLLRGNPKRSDLFAFYEYIAHPEVAAVVHSMKADAIRASGEFASRHLQGRSVLDVGCGLGYLTTWYALIEPDIEVVGVDTSPSTITQAQRMAQSLLGCARKPSFVMTDVNRLPGTQRFDRIVDTQGLIDTQVSVDGLRSLFARLTAGGRIVCVPAFGHDRLFDDFLDKLTAANAAVTSCEWAPFRDLGAPSAYPGLVLAAATDVAALSPEAALMSQEVV